MVSSYICIYPLKPCLFHPALPFRAVAVCAYVHLFYSFKLQHTIPLYAWTTQEVYPFVLLRWQVEFWLLLILCYYSCPGSGLRSFLGWTARSAVTGHSLTRSVLPSSCSLQGSGHAVILHWPAPSTCFCHGLADFCCVSLFLMWVYKDWPVQFALLCLNCSYPSAIFLLAVLPFSYCRKI